MVSLNRENTAEDVKRRLDALTDYEQRAVAAIMEAEDYSIEEALDIVEGGRCGFHPEVTSLADLAWKLIHKHGWYGIDPDTLVKIGPYIDYDALGSILCAQGWRETGFGAVLILEAAKLKRRR